MQNLTMSKIKLALDVLLTVAYVIAMEPRVTGFSWHEWLGMALGGAAVIHILLNWRWVFHVTRRFFNHVGWQARINYILNLALFVSFFTLVGSGIIISENLNTIEALGMSRDTSMTWKEIHVWMPEVTLIILGIHLGLNWKWVVNTTRRALPFISRRAVRRSINAPDLSASR